MAGHDIRAEARAISISAQKVRLVVDLVRGKGVVEALDMLKFMSNRAAATSIEAAGFCNGERRRKFWCQPR